jgi:ribosomal-protein-alanine N-acetyltransferase
MLPLPDARRDDAALPEVAWRAGTIGDVPAVAAMSAASFEPHFRESWTAPQIAVVVAGTGGLLHLATARGAPLPVAFALGRVVMDEVELLLCATDRDWRRRGLGRAAIDAMADAAARRGAKRLFLEVRESNAAARALYRESGLAEIGRRPGYYRTAAGEPIAAITLSRTIG